MTMRRSLVASVAGRYIVFALQIASTIILAHLLTPAEMGVWSVAQSAIFLSAALRDFGASDYLIRTGDMSPKSIGRIFGLMLSVSVACAAVLWFGRGVIADFFGEPRLAGMMDIMVVTYLLTPLGLGAVIVMEREFAFTSLQIMQVAATIAGSATSITMAYYGFSFYSLAWGQLIQLVVLLVLRGIARPWAVFCRPVFSGWKDMLHFGTYTTMIGLLGQISTQAVTTIIGRILGFSNLGFYERANGTNNYVRDLTFSIMQVVYVGLSIVKDKPAEFAGLFVISLENLTGVFWPAYAFLMLLAGPIVVVLFGAAWAPAASSLSIICAGGILVSSCSVHSRLLTSLGHVRAIFLIEAVGMAIRLPAVLFLSRYGLQWTVVGVVAPYLVTVFLYWREIRAHVFIQRATVIAALRRSFLVMLATISIPAVLLASGLIVPWSAGPKLALCMAASGMSWLIAIYALHHPLRREISVALDHGGAALRRLRASRRASGGSELI